MRHLNVGDNTEHFEELKLKLILILRNENHEIRTKDKNPQWSRSISNFKN